MDIKKTITKSPVVVSAITKSNFQKAGSLTAELRQEVVTTSHYPSTNMGNSLNSGLFSSEDFNLKTKDFESRENRVAFINVPEKMDTVEKVQNHLKQFEGLCLYKILSNKPILSKEDENAIEQGFISLDTKANSQVVRYPEGHEQSGELALTLEGKVQYRRICISTVEKQDEDLRTSNMEDMYLSTEISAELNATSVEVHQEQKLA